MDKNETSKICQRCKLRLPLSSFGKNSSKQLGVASYCKPCDTSRRNEWTRSNKARALEIQARYRAKKKLAPKVQKLPTPSMKLCSSCKELLPSDCFTKNVHTPDWLNRDCKPCARKKVNAWRESNRAKFNAAAVKYRQRNHEHVLEIERKRNSKPEVKERNRQNCRKHRSLYPERVKMTYKKQSENLTPAYVCAKIGVSVRDAPKELIEAKRIQIQIRRYLENGN